MPATPSDPALRYTGTALAGLGTVAVAALLFTALLALVVSGWPVLATLDVAVVDAANARVSQVPFAVSALRFVTNLGGAEASWALLPATAGWLALRGSPRHALFVAVTGLRALVLVDGIKALVGRLRPVVGVPLAAFAGESFPSGHALGSTVTYGVLVLVFGGALPRHRRRLAVIAAVALVWPLA